MLTNFQPTLSFPLDPMGVLELFLDWRMEYWSNDYASINFNKQKVKLHN